MDAARRFLRWNRDQRASPELLGLITGAGYAGENVLWVVKRQREEEVGNLVVVCKILFLLLGGPKDWKFSVLTT